MKQANGVRLTVIAKSIGVRLRFVRARRARNESANLRSQGLSLHAQMIGGDETIEDLLGLKRAEALNTRSTAPRLCVPQEFAMRPTEKGALIRWPKQSRGTRHTQPTWQPRRTGSCLRQLLSQLAAA